MGESEVFNNLLAIATPKAIKAEGQVISQYSAIIDLPFALAARVSAIVAPQRSITEEDRV